MLCNSSVRVQFQTFSNVHAFLGCLLARLILSGACRICAGTWNAGGKAPPDDLDIAEWLGTRGEGEPADIYVLG